MSETRHDDEATAPFPVQSDDHDLSIQINIERHRERGTYSVRCHGANGTATIDGAGSLDGALEQVADWARRQAVWRRSGGGS